MAENTVKGFIQIVSQFDKAGIQQAQQALADFAKQAEQTVPAREPLDQVGVSAAQAVPKVNALGEALRQIGTIAAGILAANTIGKLFNAFMQFPQLVMYATQFGAQVETLQGAMEQMGKVAGLNVGKMNEQIDRMVKGWTEVVDGVEVVHKGAITASDAIQTMMGFISSELPTERINELTEAAKDMGFVFGKTTSDTLTRFTYAIVTGNLQLLRQVGIIGYLDDVMKEYAKTVKKATSELTTAEMNQAILNFILKEATVYAGQYDKAMGSVGKQTSSLQRIQENFTVALGQAFLPFLQMSVTAKTKWYEFLADFFEKNKVVFRAASEEVRDFVGTITDFLFGKLRSVVSGANLESFTISGVKIVASIADGMLSGVEAVLRATEWILTQVADFLKRSGVFDWGVGLMETLANGILQGAGFVLDAIVSVINVIASFLAAFSPPEKGPLKDIAKWGLNLMNTYLRAMTLADFSILDAAAGAVAQYLSNLAAMGEMAPLEAVQRMIQIRIEMAQALTELAQAGQISVSTWESIRATIGADADELERYVRLLLQVRTETQSIQEAEIKLAELREQHRKRLEELENRVLQADRALEDFRMQVEGVPQRYWAQRERQLRLASTLERRAAEDERRRMQTEQEAAQTQINLLKATTAQTQATLSLEQAIMSERTKIIGLLTQEAEIRKKLGTEDETEKAKAAVTDYTGKIDELNEKVKQLRDRWHELFAPVEERLNNIKKTILDIVDIFKGLFGMAPKLPEMPEEIRGMPEMWAGWEKENLPAGFSEASLKRFEDITRAQESYNTALKVAETLESPWEREAAAAQALEDYNKKVETAQEDLNKVASTGWAVGDRLREALKDITTSFGSLLDKLREIDWDRIGAGFGAIADQFARIGKFLDEHPTFTKVVEILAAWQAVASISRAVEAPIRPPGPLDVIKGVVGIPGEIPKLLGATGISLLAKHFLSGPLAKVAAMPGIKGALAKLAVASAPGVLTGAGGWTQAISTALSSLVMFGKARMPTAAGGVASAVGRWGARIFGAPEAIGVAGARVAQTAVGEVVGPKLINFLGRLATKGSLVASIVELALTPSDKNVRIAETNLGVLEKTWGGVLGSITKKNELWEDASNEQMQSQRFVVSEILKTYKKLKDGGKNSLDNLTTEERNHLGALETIARAKIDINSDVAKSYGVFPPEVEKALAALRMKFQEQPSLQISTEWDIESPEAELYSKLPKEPLLVEVDWKAKRLFSGQELGIPTEPIQVEIDWKAKSLFSGQELGAPTIDWTEEDFETLLNSKLLGAMEKPVKGLVSDFKKNFSELLPTASDILEDLHGSGIIDNWFSDLTHFLIRMYNEITSRARDSLNDFVGVWKSILSKLPGITSSEMSDVYQNLEYFWNDVYYQTLRNTGWILNALDSFAAEVRSTWSGLVDWLNSSPLVFTSRTSTATVPAAVSGYTDLWRLWTAQGGSGVLEDFYAHLRAIGVLSPLGGGAGYGHPVYALQEGAIAFKPILARIAEREPEVVAPLSKLSQIIAPTKETVIRATFNQTFEGAISREDKEEIARTAQEASYRGLKEALEAI